MQVRFVGCGDALGSGGRFNTCFHITDARINFLIDCGASSLPALKRLGIARDDIDLILITHFHGDHFGGLPFLLLDAQFTRRTRPLVIAGPEAIETRLVQVMEALFENSSKTKQRFDLSVVALKPGETRAFGAVELLRMKMPDGYRIMPHWHPTSETVTVLSGQFRVGMGGKFDESTLTALPAHSVAVVPPHHNHYAMAKGETDVQVNAIGPFKLVYVNAADDPTHTQSSAAPKKKGGAAPKK